MTWPGLIWSVHGKSGIVWSSLPDHGLVCGYFGMDKAGDWLYNISWLCSKSCKNDEKPFPIHYIHVFWTGIVQVSIQWKCMNVVHCVARTKNQNVLQRVPKIHMRKSWHSAHPMWVFSVLKLDLLRGLSPSWITQPVGLENESNVREGVKRLISEPLLILAYSDNQTNHSQRFLQFLWQLATDCEWK